MVAVIWAPFAPFAPEEEEDAFTPVPVLDPFWSERPVLFVLGSFYTYLPPLPTFYGVFNYPFLPSFAPFC